MHIYGPVGLQLEMKEAIRFRKWQMFQWLFMGVEWSPKLIPDQRQIQSISYIKVILSLIIN